MLAASSTAESRVGGTPRSASARAPSAEARVKGSGQRDGDRRQHGSEHQRNDLPHRQVERLGISHQDHDDDAIEQGEIAHHTHNGFLLGAFGVRGANEFRSASKFRARSGRRDLRNRFTAPHQRSRIRFEPGASFDRNDSLVSMDWSSSTDPSVRRTSAATTAPSDSFTISPSTSPAAGTVAQTLSRRTDAFSANRDFSAARVA